MTVGAGGKSLLAQWGSPERVKQSVDILNALFGLKYWREPILNHFDNHTTNGFTEGCNTKIKMLKRISYGLKNVEVYWRKMLLGFVPSRSSFHTI